MSDDNNHVICSLNFCTSYTQATVQYRVRKNGKAVVKDIILPSLGTVANSIDLIATQNDNEAEWV